MSDRDPITGPIPVTIEITPTAVVLDMAALRDLIITDVVEALLDPADTTLWDRLHDLADTEQQPADGQCLTEQLVANLAERCSSRVPLYGHRARELAERLLRLSGPRAVPVQREAGAA